MKDPGPVFDALGDPTRRRVFLTLTELGAAGPSELARALPITRQAISKHLSLLDDAGLVASARNGRRTVYEPTPERLADAVTWMADAGAAWDRRLARLRTQLGRRGRR